MSARRVIVAALSEDSMGGIATLQDVDRAEQLVDAHAAEVRREDAARLLQDRARYSGQTVYCAGITHAAGLLTAWANEASKTRGETGAADFFQTGHTYADPESDWKFRVDTITTRPDDGECTALGWRHFQGEWKPYAYDKDDFEIHLLAGFTDVTGEAS